MKIKVDYDLCEANAICMRESPKVFEVDDDDNLQVLVEEPGEELHARRLVLASLSDGAGAAAGLICVPRRNRLRSSSGT